MNAYERRQAIKKEKLQAGRRNISAVNEFVATKVAMRFEDVYKKIYGQTTLLKYKKGWLFWKEKRYSVGAVMRMAYEIEMKLEELEQ